MSAGYLQINGENVKIISGHVSAKKGWLYWVLNLPDASGVCKPKWVATHLKEKGNKTKAKDMLGEVREEWTKKVYLELHGLKEKSDTESNVTIIAAEEKTEENESSPLFSDFLMQWLDYKYQIATHQALGKKSLELNTYAGYECNVKNPVGPYFQSHPIKVVDLTKEDIEDFYTFQLVQKQKAVTTVKHYHAVIHGALEYAIELKLIKANPADRIGFPSQNSFKGDYYYIHEVRELFEAAKGLKMEIPIVLACFYGLRRSEVIGLKWSAFNFANNVFTIRHTVTSCNVKGEHMEIAKDKAKSKTSLRSLPLVPFIRNWLLEKRAQQEKNRKLCGRSYCTKYLDYICVDPLGRRLKPNYITCTFSNILGKNNLRHIRFHDLRHTCAALLAASGVGIEDIMKWLGHSDIKITSEFYLHLEFNSKVSSANSLLATYQSNDTALTLTENVGVMEEQTADALKAQISMLQKQIQSLQSQLDVQSSQAAAFFETKKAVSMQTDSF